MSVFKKNDVKFCSVPIPSINSHKGADFSFTDAQISAYKQSQTHPSVLYFKDKWNGHDFWLATTPYPSATGCFENPCIYYGDFQDNGKPPVIWNPIPNNPITKINSKDDINSDCDLIELNGVMYMISRDNNKNHNPYMQKSTNGIDWTNRDYDKPLWFGDNPEKISPSFISVDNNIFAYSITGQAGNSSYNEQLNTGSFKGILRYKGTTLENGGDFEYDCKIYIHGAKRKIAPWHFDVFIHDNKYYMILCAKNRLGNNDMCLYMASSDDGVNFYMYAYPLFNAYPMYRPTACVDLSGNLIVYLSTTSAIVSSDQLPKADSDLSQDGRYIGCLTKPLLEVIQKLESMKLITK